jgi:L-aspartate oxidase
VAGVERQGSELLGALAEVRQRRSLVEAEPLLATARALEPGERLLLQGTAKKALLGLHDLRQRLVLADLLMEAAGFRAESRGGHFRTDAPAAQPFWRYHTLQRRGASISTQPVGTQGVGSGPL